MYTSSNYTLTTYFYFKSTPIDDRVIFLLSFDRKDTFADRLVYFWVYVHVTVHLRPLYNKLTPVKNKIYKNVSPLNNTIY